MILLLDHATRAAATSRDIVPPIQSPLIP